MLALLALLIVPVISLKFQSAVPCASDYDLYDTCHVPKGETPTNKCRHPQVLVKEDLDSEDCPIAKKIRGSNFPSNEDLASQNLFNWSTCAIVGGSAKLLKCGMGSQIDKHDAVIRCNDNPVVGFEHEVGSKTSIRLLNNRVRPNFTEDFDESLKIRFEISSYNMKSSWYVNPYIVKLAQKVAGLDPSGSKIRSCGGVAVMFAFASCKSVDMYGFGPENGRYTHYFNPSKTVWAGHSVAMEQRWFKCLHGERGQCKRFQKVLNLMPEPANLTMHC